VQRKFRPSSKGGQQMCLLCLQKGQKGVEDKGDQVIQRWYKVHELFVLWNRKTLKEQKMNLLCSTNWSCIKIDLTA